MLVSHRAVQQEQEVHVGVSCVDELGACNSNGLCRAVQLYLYGWEVVT